MKNILILTLTSILLNGLAFSSDQNVETKNVKAQKVSQVKVIKVKNGELKAECKGKLGDCYTLQAKK